MDKIAELLQALAEQLGTTTEYLWPILVKQQMVETVYHGAWCIFGLIIIIVALRIYSKGFKPLFKKDDRTYSEDGDVVALGVAIAVIILLGVSISINAGYETLTHLIVPEAEALEWLLHHIK